MHSSNIQYALNHCQNYFAFCRNWVLYLYNYKLNFYFCEFLKDTKNDTELRKIFIWDYVMQAVYPVYSLLTKFSSYSLQVTRTTITGPLKYPNHLPHLCLQKIPLSFRGTALVLFSIKLYTPSRGIWVFTGEGWYEMNVISFLYVNKTRKHETLLPTNKSYSQ